MSLSRFTSVFVVILSDQFRPEDSHSGRCINGHAYLMAANLFDVDRYRPIDGIDDDGRSGVAC